MTFNLKKQAQPMHTDQMLVEDNKEKGLGATEQPGNYDWLLKNKGRKNKDNTLIHEKQLAGVRNAGQDEITEKKLDYEPQVYNARRFDKAVANPIPVVNFVQEAHDQKHYRAVREAEGDGFTDPDTMFWDNFVGVDVNKKTKIVKSKFKSQLENHPDRFEGLDKTMPIDECYKLDQDVMTKKDKVYDMVTASVKDADAMLFNVYATAEFEKRGLTEEEQDIITSINAGKAKFLAFANGDFKLKEIIKKANGKHAVRIMYVDKNAGSIKTKTIETFDDVKQASRKHIDAFVVGDSNNTIWKQGQFSQEMLNEQHPGNHKIKITYEVVSPASAAKGDVDDRGWIDEEGRSVEPDQWDREEGKTVVDITVEFLSSEGANEPSSSPWSPGTWYTNSTYDEDLQTGEVTSQSYHLEGFTSEEEQAIFDRMQLS